MWALRPPHDVCVLQAGERLRVLKTMNSPAWRFVIFLSPLIQIAAGLAVHPNPPAVPAAGNQPGQRVFLPLIFNASACPDNSGVPTRRDRPSSGTATTRCGWPGTTPIRTWRCAATRAIPAPARASRTTAPLTARARPNWPAGLAATACRPSPALTRSTPGIGDLHPTPAPAHLWILSGYRLVRGPALVQRFVADAPRKKLPLRPRIPL